MHSKSKARKFARYNYDNHTLILQILYYQLTYACANTKGCVSAKSLGALSRAYKLHMKNIVKLCNSILPMQNQLL